MSPPRHRAAPGVMPLDIELLVDAVGRIRPLLVVSPLDLAEVVDAIPAGAALLEVDEDLAPGTFRFLSGHERDRYLEEHRGAT